MWISHGIFFMGRSHATVSTWRLHAVNVTSIYVFANTKSLINYCGLLQEEPLMVSYSLVLADRNETNVLFICLEDIKKRLNMPNYSH